jgi:hypothetical protein
MVILSWIVFGLVIGIIAKLLMPGGIREASSCDSAGRRRDPDQEKHRRTMGLASAAKSAGWLCPPWARRFSWAMPDGDAATGVGSSRRSRGRTAAATRASSFVLFV